MRQNLYRRTLTNRSVAASKLLERKGGSTLHADLCNSWFLTYTRDHTYTTLHTYMGYYVNKYLLILHMILLDSCRSISTFSEYCVHSDSTNHSYLSITQNIRFTTIMFWSRLNDQQS